MRHQGALDLDRGHAVPRDIHDVIDATQKPEVTVLIDARPVAREVNVFESAPVRLDVAVVILEDPAKHRRPGLLQHQVATAPRADFLTLLAVHRGLYRGERL